MPRKPKEPPAETSRSDEDTTGWLTKAETAKELKRSSQTVRRLQNSGKLHPAWSKERGCWLYDPDELKEINDEDFDDIDSKSLLEAAASLLGTAQEHVESVMEYMIRVQEREHATHKLLALENDRNRTRIQSLEGERSAMFDAMEKARSKEHERAMDMKLFESKQQNRAKFFEMTKPLVPALMKSIESKLFGKAEPAGEETPLTRQQAIELLVGAIAAVPEEMVVMLDGYVEAPFAEAVKTVRAARLKNQKGPAINKALGVVVETISKWPPTLVQSIGAVVGADLAKAVDAVRKVFN